MQIKAVPSPDDVKPQLGRILASDGFRLAEMRRRLLEYIVEWSFDNSAMQLDGRSIARDVFREPPDFQTAENSRVRVAVNRLRLALRLYYAEAGCNDDIIIDIPQGNYAAQFSFRQDVDKFPETDELGQELHKLYWRYQSNASAKTHEAAYRVAIAAQDMMSDDADNLGILAELAQDARALGYGDEGECLDTTYRAIERVNTLEPDNPQLLISMAFADLADSSDPKDALRHTDAIEKSLDEAISAIGLWLRVIATAEDLATGDAQLLRSASSRLDWMCHVPFLSAYRRGDYELSLSEVTTFATPRMWGHIDRTAAFGQLGLRKCAEAELDRLNELCPDFRSNPERYLKYYVPYENDKLHVLEGLQRAGLTAG